MSDRHPSTEQIVQWFDTEHHGEDLKKVSEPVEELVTQILDELPDSPELTTGLRKLLEAKDCFVRAAVAKRKDA